MSQRDRDRLVVLAGIEHGHWSQREGAAQLGLSTRWVRKRLAEDGMRVSRETLRKWMAEEGLWQVRKKRLRQVHVWRQRRAARGELVMMDSSRFRWLEERGPELYLIAMIDDATSRLWGRFVEHDSTEENLRTLGQAAVALYGPEQSVCDHPTGAAG